MLVINAEGDKAMTPSIYADVMPLPWESDFFAMPSARLAFSDTAQALTPDALAAYAVVQAKVPTQASALVDTLSASGFHLAETEVDLCLSVASAAPARVVHRVALAADIPALRDVAARIFTLSRFRTPWYRVHDSGRFYAQWVENAVRGTFDDVCLIVDSARGEPRGWVTLRQISEDQARIGLLSVWPGHEGQGVGSQLMALAVHWCQQRQLTQLWVATQLANTSALRLYQRCGAQIQSSSYWFYK